MITILCLWFLLDNNVNCCDYNWIAMFTLVITIILHFLLLWLQSDYNVYHCDYSMKPREELQPQKEWDTPSLIVSDQVYIDCQTVSICNTKRVNLNQRVGGRGGILFCRGYTCHSEQPVILDRCLMMSWTFRSPWESF